MSFLVCLTLILLNKKLMKSGAKRAPRDWPLFWGRIGLAIIKGHVCLFLEGHIAAKSETTITFILLHEADLEGLRIYKTSCCSTLCYMQRWCLESM